METIFTRGPSLTTRLVIALLLSVGLMISDHRFHLFDSSRVYLNSLVSPLQYIANLPSFVLNEVVLQLRSHHQLTTENQQLKEQLLLSQVKVQQFDALLNENNQLRQLLSTSARENVQVMITQLMAIDNSPYTQQVVINKGTLDGVYLGQPVLDDAGIVGQISEVGSTNSRVLLLSDNTHALPVRVLRNDIRFIAVGTGTLLEVMLEHVPHSSDVMIGDTLVSSGLGGVFPEGYPVAVVTRVINDEGRPFKQVFAKPLARLDRLKHMLLVWPEHSDEGQESQ